MRSEGNPSKEQKTHQPLAGRRVLLTRARKQSEEIGLRLARRGAEVVYAPMIMTIEPDSWAALDEAIEKLESYNALIFTSANGVRFFLQRLAQKRPQASTSGILICAIGKATAKALTEAGLNADVIAGEAKAEGLLEAIIERLGGEANLTGWRFLLPRARIAREVLPEALGKLGATVDAVEAYQTIRPEADSTELIRQFEDGAIDVITFTSPSTVTNFVITIGIERIAELLRNTCIACIGPITTATAKEYGLSNIIQPATYTADALVDAIAEAFKPFNRP